MDKLDSPTAGYNFNTRWETLGVFDLKRRCAEWSVYDISTAREIREQMDPYAFELLSLYFDVIHQGSSNLSLEGQSAAEFSSNPDQTHLPVIF